ncbi:MAG: thioredoxin domain-containing protein [Armatimonadota bacterium]
MSKKIVLSAFIMLFALCFTFGASAENLSQQAGKYSPDKVYEIANQKHIPLVMVFYADWCSESNAYLPVINELENTYGNKIIFLKINVESADNRSFVEKYKKNKYLPETIIYKRDFEKLVNFTGKKNKQEMINYINSL